VDIAASIAGLRAQHRQHCVPLGHYVSAADAAKHIRALMIERLSRPRCGGRAWPGRFEQLREQMDRTVEGEESPTRRTPALNQCKTVKPE
jgi:hypothetical protein